MAVESGSKHVGPCVLTRVRRGLAAFVFAAATLSAGAGPAAAQDPECAARIAERGRQAELAARERQRAAVLDDAARRARSIFSGIAEAKRRDPRHVTTYTPANLHAAMRETRDDPSFGTDTWRGIMLETHARILDRAADFAAGNEFLDMIGLQQSPASAVRELQTQFQSEAQDAEARARRHDEAVASLPRNVIDCMIELAEEARARLIARDAAGTAPREVPPPGLTTLCHLTSGDRQGQTVDLSKERGTPTFVPIGDICYDPRSPDDDLGIGYAVAP